MTWLGWIKTKLTKIKLLSVCQELKQDLLNELFGLKKEDLRCWQGSRFGLPIETAFAVSSGSFGVCCPWTELFKPKSIKSICFFKFIFIFICLIVLIIFLDFLTYNVYMYRRGWKRFSWKVFSSRNFSKF